MISAAQANEIYSNYYDEYFKKEPVQYILNACLEEIEKAIIQSSQKGKNHTNYNVTFRVGTIRKSNKFSQEELPIYDEETITLELQKQLNNNHFLAQTGRSGTGYYLDIVW